MLFDAYNRSGSDIILFYKIFFASNKVTEASTKLLIKISVVCKTMTELKDKNGSAYKSALKYGWLDEIFN